MNNSFKTLLLSAKNRDTEAVRELFEMYVSSVVFVRLRFPVFSLLVKLTEAVLPAVIVTF